jgi:hypothetical protein
MKRLNQSKESIAAFKCALNCLAAANGMSRGTPILSRKYANADATSLALSFPKQSIPTLISLKADSWAPGPSANMAPQTNLNAFSTSGINASSGAAYGSASSAPNPFRGFFAPFGPPRDANFATYKVLLSFL